MIDRLGFTIQSSLLRTHPELGLSAEAWHDFVSSPTARTLRLLQQLDEVLAYVDTEILARRYLVEAESQLGELLGLACTGEPETVNPGTGEAYTAYDHSGDTCPIHEWLVPSDQKEVSS
jgi:hypothetical protein